MKQNKTRQTPPFAGGQLADRVSGVNRNGKEFGADSKHLHSHEVPSWLEGPPVTNGCGAILTASTDNHQSEQVGPSKRPGSEWWLVAGTAVADVCYTANRLSLGVESVSFDGPAGPEILRYVGQAGDKRTAEEDLGPLLERLRLQPENGGGCVRTARALARFLHSYGLQFMIRVVDSGTPWPELLAEMKSLGVDYHALKLGRQSPNLVLTAGRDRVVIRSPGLPQVALNGEWVEALVGLGCGPAVVLINSTRSEDEAKAAIITANQKGAPVYSVATPSLSVDARIKWLVRYSRLVVMNLAEFGELAQAVGIVCPNSETMVSVPSVVAALKEFRQVVECGMSVVTLGEVGMIIACGRTIAHIGLAPEGRLATRTHLVGSQRNGLGDETFAALVVADQRDCGGVAAGTGLIYCARQAWMDVLRGLSPLLRPEETWFTIRIYTDEALWAKPNVPQQFHGVSWPEYAV